MEEARIAYVAGFMTGRGGFGLDKESYHWFYFRARDLEIATAAMHEWGGSVTERVDGGITTYKYTATGEQATRAIADVRAYLMGYKRERAEEMLAGAVA